MLGAVAFFDFSIPTDFEIHIAIPAKGGGMLDSSSSSPLWEGGEGFQIHNSKEPPAGSSPRGEGEVGGWPS